MSTGFTLDEIGQIREADVVDFMPEAMSLDDIRQASIDSKMQVGIEEATVPEYTWSEYAAEKVPFASGLISAAETYELKKAGDRIKQGKGTRQDYNLVATFLDRQKQQGDRGFWEGTGDLAASIPAFGIEFLATGGVYTGVRKGLQETGEALIKKKVQREVAKGVTRTQTGRLARKATQGVALETVPRAAGVAAQTVANPQLWAANVTRRMIPDMNLAEDDIGQAHLVIADNDKSFVEALGPGFLDSYIEMASERAGTIIGRIPAIKGLKGAIVKRFLSGDNTTKQLSELLKKSGWHGVLEEMGEERVGELARGATGLEDNYGVLTKLHTSEGWQQLLQEAIAFSAPGAGVGGINFTGRKMQDRKTAKRLQTKEGAIGWALTHPLEAEGIRQNEQPSRSQWREAGLPPMSGANRTDFVTVLNGLAGVLADEAQAQEETQDAVQEREAEEVPAPKAPEVSEEVGPEVRDKGQEGEVQPPLDTPENWGIEPVAQPEGEVTPAREVQVDSPKPEVSGSSPEGITLYHGTDKEGKAGIDKSGKISGKVYLTPDKEAAREYGGGEEAEVVELSINPSDLGVDFDLPGGRLLDVESANEYTGNVDWTIQDYIDSGQSVGVDADVLVGAAEVTPATKPAKVTPAPKAPVKPAKTKDKIVAAAVQIDGQVFEAPTHIQALEKARDAGLISDDMVELDAYLHPDDKASMAKKPGDSVDLFRTSSGRLIGRDEAQKLSGSRYAEDIDIPSQPAAPEVPAKQPTDDETLSLFGRTAAGQTGIEPSGEVPARTSPDIVSPAPETKAAESAKPKPTEVTSEPAAAPVEQKKPVDKFFEDASDEEMQSLGEELGLEASDRAGIIEEIQKNPAVKQFIEENLPEDGAQFTAKKPARRMTRDKLKKDLEAAFVSETGAVEVTEIPEGFEVTLPNGRKIKALYLTAGLKVDVKAAAKAYGKSEQEIQQMLDAGGGAAGSVSGPNTIVQLDDGTTLTIDDVTALIDPSRATDTTAKHEALHVARRLGLFDSTEGKKLWDSLEKEYGSEEGIAAARELWTGPEGLWQKIRDYLRRVMGALKGMHPDVAMGKTFTEGFWSQADYRNPDVFPGTEEAGPMTPAGGIAYQFADVERAKLEARSGRVPKTVGADVAGAFDGLKSFLNTEMAHLSDMVDPKSAWWQPKKGQSLIEYGRRYFTQRGVAELRKTFKGDKPPAWVKDKKLWEAIKTDLTMAEKINSGEVTEIPATWARRFLSTNTKTGGLSWDFALMTCFPTERCSVCYAKTNATVRVNLSRARVRHTVVTALYPEAVGTAVGKWVSQQPKGMLPFLRVNGAGDSTFFWQIDSINSAIAELDRPVHIFSRSHMSRTRDSGSLADISNGRYDPAHPENGVVVYKMGSIDKQLRDEYGDKFLKENLEKRGIINSYLVGAVEDVAIVKEMREKGIFMILHINATKPVVTALDEAGLLATSDRAAEEVVSPACACALETGPLINGCATCLVSQGPCFAWGSQIAMTPTGKMYTYTELLEGRKTPKGRLVPMAEIGIPKGQGRKKVTQEVVAAAYDSAAGNLRSVVTSALHRKKSINVNNPRTRERILTLKPTQANAKIARRLADDWAAFAQKLREGKVTEKKIQKELGTLHGLEAMDRAAEKFTGRKPDVSYALTPPNTPEFKKWFGDSKLTVTGKAGDPPLDLFHGTDQQFTIFGNMREPLSALGWQMLTDSPKFAEAFAASDQPMPVPKKPFTPPRTFKKTTIKVANTDQRKKDIEVEGYTTPYKNLVIAAHGPDSHTLTHASSGMAFGGGLDLKRAVQVARKLKDFDLTVSAEEIVKTKGLVDALRLALKSAHNSMEREAKKDQPDEFAAMFGYKQKAGLGVGSQIMKVYGRMEKPLDLRGLPARNVSAKRLQTALSENGIELTNRDLPFAGRDLYQMLNDPSVAEKITRQAEQLGYDGIIFNDFYDTKNRGTTYVVFDGAQIKSATGNRGTFDPAERDINYALKPGQRGIDALREFLAKEKAPKPGPETTGTKNVKTNELRSIAGLSERPDVMPETMAGWDDKAAARMADDPLYAGKLASEMAENPKAIDEIDNMVLSRHLRDLENRRQAGEDVLDEIRVAVEASEKVGTIWGRAGVSRQSELNADFSMAGIVRQHIRATTEQPSDAQMEKYAEMAAEIEKLTAENDDLKKRAAEQSIQETIDSAAGKKRSRPKKGTKRERLQKAAQKATADFKSEWDKLFTVGVVYDPKSEADKWIAITKAASKVIKAYAELGVESFLELTSRIKADIGDLSEDQMKAFRDMWPSNRPESPLDQSPSSESIGAFAKELTRWAVESGITEREAVITAVHKELQDMGVEISRDDTMQAMSGYGEFSELSKDNVSVIVRGIKGEIQQLLKLKDMRAGEAPKKTGRERRTPTDAERQLIKEVNEAKKRGGYTVTDPERQLKSALETAKTTVKNRIKDLDNAIANRERIKNERKSLKPDEELNKLRKRRDGLNVEYRKLFPPKRTALTDEQRLRRTMQSLQRQIDQLTKDLAEGNLGPKQKPVPLTSAEVEAKKQERKVLQQAMDEARAASPEYQAKMQEREDANYMKTLERQLAFWEKRRDEAIVGKLPEKRKQRPLNDEMREKRYQIELVKRHARAEIEAAEREARGKFGKALGFGGDLLDLSRAIMTGYEMSAFLRQGAYYTGGFPLKALAAARDSVAAALSRRVDFSLHEDLMNRPNHQDYMTGNMQITVADGPLSHREETIRSRIASWLSTKEGVLWAGGRWAAELLLASERSFRTFSNTMRADLFDYMKDSVEASRPGTWSDEDAKIVGNASNVFSGRAPMRNSVGWSRVFFAPSYVWSRAKLIAGEPMWKGDAATRKTVAKVYVRGILGMAAMQLIRHALYSLGADDEEDEPVYEIDPRSSDFGKTRIGDTRSDPGAGVNQLVTLGARLLTGQTKRRSGEIVDVRGEEAQYGSDDVRDILHRFLDSKLAPLPSAVLDFMAGENVVGEKATIGKIVGERMSPMTWRDIWEAEKELNVPQGIVAATEAFFGTGLATYGDRTRYREADAEERTEMFDKYLKQMTWDSQMPEFAAMLTPEQLQQFDKQKDKKQGMVISLAAFMPDRENYKSNETFAKKKESIANAKENLQKMSLSHEEAQELLRGNYEETNDTYWDRAEALANIYKLDGKEWVNKKRYPWHYK